MEEEGTLEINNSTEPQSTEQNKPTPEEVEAAKAEFNQAVEDWEKVQFDLAPDAKIGQSFITYLLNYMDTKMMWSQNAWMGSIKLEEEMIAIQKKYGEDTTQLPLIGYQALEFSVYILSNPGGVGLASAKAFEKEAEQHVVVLEHLEGQLEKARKILDHIKFLQEKWAAYEQGFYYDKEPTDDEMPEGSYYSERLERYLKPGDKGYDIQEFIEAIKKQYGEETAAQVQKDMAAEEAMNSTDDSVGPPLVTESN
jgi:hypothetical protein